MCGHEFQYTFGVDIADNIVAAKVCSNCGYLIKLGYPGIDKVEAGWYEAELEFGNRMLNYFIPRES